MTRTIYSNSEEWPILDKSLLLFFLFKHAFNLFFQLEIHTLVTNTCLYNQAQNVWSGWPVYELKCLCSRGRQ